MAFMTPNVLRNLFGKYSTRLYPVETRDPFEAYRGELYNDIEKCIFCQTCARKCPSQCITVSKETGEWTCDPFACVYCGICVDSCPVNCLHMRTAWRKVATERQMIVQHGTPPAPRKKAPKEVPQGGSAAENAEAPAKKADKKKAE
ncbi:4Fe-4S ferredoxin, iron-sulpur binding domain-containing protein [Desulfovibrio sp. X2]|uniref:4Fe-4S binding protein n=1 Tax=Desulfovibrio sp. X2 TaxID=941449 RepID=UPI000358D0A3|nr:4Fe-4S binding protein [Desulfovibrio sp. X2]EPR44070.1 4Fe-4S ferredoxin, iron-sulpur binding domain-containing protein [Desulfovibrio sp. X2]